MRKWTAEIRLLVYRTLVMRFGPYSEWEGKETPTVRADEYNQCISELALYIQNYFGANIGSEKNPDGIEALKQQIAWAITSQETVKPSGLFTWHENKAAAHEAGFI